MCAICLRPVFAVNASNASNASNAFNVPNAPNVPHAPNACNVSMMTDVGATRLHVQIAGEGETLVWAHGLLSSVAAEDTTGWYDWPAAAEQMRVVRYDARGHGRSAPPASPEQCEWRALGGDMLAVADRAGASRFIAGGASMGGMTAIEAALQAPARVKALVLVSPPSLWEDRVAQATHYQRVARAGRVAGGVAMATWMAATQARTFAAWPDDAMQAILAGVDVGVRDIAGTTLWALLRGAGQSDLPPRAALAALASVPALIVAWDGDATHPLASAQELHCLLPASQLLIARDHAEFCTIGARIRAFVAAHS